MKKLTILAALLLGIVMLQAKTEVISESSERAVITFRMDNYEILQMEGFTYIETVGMGFRDVPGAPVLPEITYYIAVPENGNIEVHTLHTETQRHSLSLPLLPAPVVISKDGISEYIRKPDYHLYQTRSDETIRIGEPTQFRYNYVIPVTISPVSYSYAGSEIIVAEKITFTVYISGNTEQRLPVRDATDLSANILNYQTGRYWQNQYRQEVEYAPFGKSDFWYRFEVTQNGMYKLSAQDLAALPLADLDPRTLRLFTNGGQLLNDSTINSGNPFKEVPLLVLGEENGLFNDNDAIIFYAENRDGFAKNESLSGSIRHYYNPYSGNGVYWLTFGGSFEDTPARMTTAAYGQHQVTRSSTPAYHHFENENVRREHSGFSWFHSMLTGLSDSNHNFSFNVSDVDTSKDQAVTLTVQGDRMDATNYIYRLSWRANQHTVLDRVNWTNSTGYRTFTGTGNFLQNGNNSVVMSIHRTSSATVYFDYFGIDYYKHLIKGSTAALSFQADSQDLDRTVRYQIQGDNTSLRAFEIKGAYQTSTLSLQAGTQANSFELNGRGQARYYVLKDNEYLKPVSFQEVVPRNLVGAVNGMPIQSIIITPAIFSEYAEQLAELYQTENGYNSLIVRQQEIFNQFNSGMPDPNAIKLFIRHAFYNNPQGLPGELPLQAVTLLGSGTIDWRNFSGQAAGKNQIILYHRASDTADDYFVDLTSNQLPDIAIGRITAQNEREMGIVMEKIRNYRQNPTPGLWRNTPLIVADDEHTTSHSNEPMHSIQAQQVSDMFSKAVITDKVFGFEYPFDPFGNKPAARDEIIRRVNEGRLLWYYIGHGNYDLMGHESYFRAIDVQSLTNRDKLPLFIAASCDVGKFDYFAYDSLSERLLVYPNGGSIASLAATGLSSPHPNHGLMSTFLRKIINDYQQPGVALMEAKHHQGNSQLSNNRRYAYLGDPVMPVVPPYRMENIVITGNPDSLLALQPVNISGSFLPDDNAGMIELGDYNKLPLHTPSLSATTAEISAYGSEHFLTYTVYGTSTPTVINYSKWGNIYFRGKSSILSGNYNSSFIVPSDIRKGDKGRIIAYNFDNESKTDFISYYYPKRLSNVIYHNAVPDSLPPEIRIWLNTENFRDGDIVSPDPLLYAVIEDESGINILGELGHKILLVMDANSAPVDVTSGFIYDTDSYTKGMLTWQLHSLAEGNHHFQLVVFDNYNNPAVASVGFTVSKAEKLVISNLLPYPNPLSENGDFTFKLNDNADITISIYTIRGRRIRTLKSTGISGFNKVYWDGRDQEGSRIANNTYLYKVRARQISTGKVSEEIGKVIVLR